MNEDVVYFYGDAVDTEYPEHMKWFIPGLIKKLNMLLADFDIHIVAKEINYNSYTIKFITKIKQNSIENVIYFNLINSLDELIAQFVDKINELSKENLANLIIVAYRPFNKANLSLYLANKNELDLKERFPNLVNNPFIFIPYLTEPDSSFVLTTYNDIRIQLTSKLYAGDFFLPIYPEESVKKQIIDVFNSIASLNPNNKVSFKIKEIVSTEEVTVYFISDNEEKKIHFNVYDFDRIGLELNNLLIESKHFFALITPDDDRILYGFCSPEEIRLLIKYGYLSEKYIPSLEKNIEDILKNNEIKES
jgi:hypothetical protein